LNDDIIRNYDRQGDDIWICDAHDENGPQQGLPKLRIRIHYSYSDIARYNTLLLEWHDYMTDDINDYENILQYLESLTTPFGFLKQVYGNVNSAMTKEDTEDM